MLCIAVHYQEGIKINVNKCGLFLTFTSVEQIYLFSTVTIGLSFSSELCRLNCALFAIHHCLSWAQRIRNQTFVAISKKSNVNFLLEVILFFEQRKFCKHLRVCVNAKVCVFESTHGRGSRLCFALFAWFAWAALLAGIAKTATGKACNDCKALGQLGLVCVYILRHKCSFPFPWFWS